MEKGGKSVVTGDGIVTTILLVRAVLTVLEAIALQPVVDATSVRAAKFRRFATCSTHHTHALFFFFN